MSFLQLMVLSSHFKYETLNLFFFNIYDFGKDALFVKYGYPLHMCMNMCLYVCMYTGHFSYNPGILFDSFHQCASEFGTSKCH